MHGLRLLGARNGGPSGRIDIAAPSARVKLLDWSRPHWSELTLPMNHIVAMIRSRSRSKPLWCRQGRARIIESGATYHARPRNVAHPQRSVACAGNPVTCDRLSNCDPGQKGRGLVRLCLRRTHTLIGEDRKRATSTSHDLITAAKWLLHHD